MTTVRFMFGEVRHTRLRPVLNAFVYRAFFLSVPIHELDGRPHGSWLFGINRRALISFHERDHGEGRDAGQAREWINGLLARSGIPAPATIELQAFARVFGYVFKPVSFWFCRDRDERLLAIVAEVNNTFGERHCYLLADPSAAALRNGAELQAAKVFHVSPFCETDGRYHFRFLHTGQRCVARVDYHDAQGPLLLTSLSGRARVVDTRSCVHALFAYPLFTFGVVARIHWQALRLWLRRVPLVRKPQPPVELVSRGTP